MTVGESCKTCKKACIAKVGISTTQSISRASTEISHYLFVDLSFVLLMYLHFRGPSGNQIRPLEKGIINDRGGISSYIYIYRYIYIYMCILEFDLSLDRDRACRNSQVKVQCSKVDMISKFRHSVGI